MARREFWLIAPGLAPENTLLAFQNMIKNRDKFELEGFEFDLHLTKDGQIIVLHDDTLDRTSDSEEYFGKSGVLPCDLSFEELQKLNMGEKFVLPDGSIPYEGLRQNSGLTPHYKAQRRI